MFFTHIYDLAVKIGVLFISIIVLNACFPSFTAIGGIVVFASLVISTVLYFVFLRTLGSYLYCRLTLKMNINFKEAKALNEALAPNSFPSNNFRWLTLKEVKHLDAVDKYATAIAILNNWKQEKIRLETAQIRESKNKPATIKRLEILSIIIVVVSFATSFLNLPPATFVIKFYCRLFETDDYSPFFISCVMLLIALTPIMLFKRHIENNLK